MEQNKIGMFIKECRKGKNLTQQELADRLMVSFKTISKWECGKGMPDCSLMLPLCDELGITVNELLSASHLEDSDYKHKAEENLIESIRLNEGNKKHMFSLVIVEITFLLCYFAFIVSLPYLPIKEVCKTIIILSSLAILVTNLIAVCLMDNSIGCYKCRKCKHLFVPTFKEYIIASHGPTTRRLKCPNCGEKSFCKKVLSKKHIIKK
jgi:transcriptional regulator with XRE-family HTH domain/DNA-directed RNA polymerase subunit RPC12/RpoP